MKAGTGSCVFDLHRGDFLETDLLLGLRFPITFFSPAIILIVCARGRCAACLIPSSDTFFHRFSTCICASWPLEMCWKLLDEHVGPFFYFLTRLLRAAAAVQELIVSQRSVKVTFSRIALAVGWKMPPALTHEHILLSFLLLLTPNSGDCKMSELEPSQKGPRKIGPLFKGAKVGGAHFCGCANTTTNLPPKLGAHIVMVGVTPTEVDVLFPGCLPTTIPLREEKSVEKTCRVSMLSFRVTRLNYWKHKKWFFVKVSEKKNWLLLWSNRNPGEPVIIHTVCATQLLPPECSCELCLTRI